MARAAGRRRQAFVLGAALVLIACLLPCASALATQTREGTLQVAEGDGPEGEDRGPEYSLETASGTVALVPSEISEGASSGDTAKVTGSMEEGKLVGNVNVTAQASEAAPESQTVLVLAVNFPGEPTWSLEGIREAIFTGQKSANTFYQDESYGQVSLAGKLNPNGDIFGWFEIPKVSTCAPETVRQEANEVAKENGISLSGYDHIVYVHSYIPCWWGGLASIGGDWVNINAQQGHPLFTHELGHNLGFRHAESMTCRDEEGNLVPVSDDCTVVEYGDPFDTMGVIENFRHNAASRLEQLGVLGPENVTTIEKDGTYELESALEPTTGTVELRIPRFFNANGQLIGYYELEIRKQGGLFEGKADKTMTGVTIRKMGLNGTSATYLYDTQILPTGGKEDAPLPVGKTFSDGTVSITTLAAGEGKATVEVDVGPESDLQAPTAPTGLTTAVVAEGVGGVNLSWSAATDNVGVVRYVVYRDGEEIGTSSETSFSDTHAPVGLHAYVVYAEDEAGNRSPASAAATATVSAPFTIPPKSLFSFGANGTGPGQFQTPFGVASDSAGNIWVSDTQGDRVEKFNEKGEFLLQFGSTGSGNGQLNEPRGLAVTAAGDLWVVDSGNDRLQEFNKEGKYLGQFGSMGSGNGQFVLPTDVAIAPDGSLWVADDARSVVQKFTASGAFILKAGSYGTGNGQFNGMNGIATDAAGDVWVADRFNSRVEELSPNGAYLTKLGSNGTGPGQFLEPYDIAVKPDGTLLVVDLNHLDYAHSRVEQLTADGHFLGQIVQSHPQQVGLGRGGQFFVVEASGTPEVTAWSQPLKPEATTKAATAMSTTSAFLNATVNPSGAETTYWFEYGKTTSYGTDFPASPESIGSGNRPLTELGFGIGLQPETNYHYRVVAENREGITYGEDMSFSTVTPVPTFLGNYGKSGSEPGKFNYPEGIATDKSGNVWVADRQGNRIERFNEKGEFISQFGAAGTGEGALNAPEGIAATSSGDLWVVDAGNCRIERYNSNGFPLSRFGSCGTGNGQFVSPWGIAIAPDGSIWVSDIGRDDVQKFSASGAFIAKAGGPGSGNGQFLNPRGLSVDGEGHVWIADQGNSRIEELSSSGAFLAKLGTEGSGNEQLDEPMAVTVKANGNLMIADGYPNHRVLQWSPGGHYQAIFTKGPVWEPLAIALGKGGKSYILDGVQRMFIAYAQQAPPEATTGAATELKTTEATLNGTVNPAAAVTTYRFEYGTTTSYGSQIPATPKSVGSGSEPVAVSEVLSGLPKETVYHYRLVAESSKGVAYGEDATFVTQAVTPTSLFSFGSEGSGKGQFESPVGIATDASGNVWVSDSQTDRIEKFNEKGEFLLQFGGEGSGPGQFKFPQGMATTPSGDLWVADLGNHRVQEFNSEGKYLGQIGGAAGSGNGQFLEPLDVTIAPDGSIWVSDGGRRDIQKFTSSGTFILKAGKSGTGNGEFLWPYGIDTDSAGNLWVADQVMGRLQKLSPTGSFLSKIELEGGGPEEPNPRDVVVKPNGTLLVSDHDYQHVLLLTPEGRKLGEIPAENPQKVALGRGGKIFVADAEYGSQKVSVWSQPTAPDATTEAATDIKSAEVTLNATINPIGVATTYQFEYGTTTSYGSKIPNPPGSAGSGTEPVAVSVTRASFTPGTLYHYRVAATSEEGTTYGRDMTFETASSGLEGLPVAQSFDGGTPSTEGFTKEWTALSWASGAAPKGQDTTTGWRPETTSPAVNGAFYAPTLTDAGSGAGVAATLSAGPTKSSDYVSLWLDLSSGASREGYELRFTPLIAGIYEVTLGKWVGGSRTALASKLLSLAAGGSFGLVDSGATVTVWTKTAAASAFSELFSASDTAFSSGKAAIEGTGTATRLKNFKAGAIE